jgi:hypothetical protein
MSAGTDGTNPGHDLNHQHAEGLSPLCLLRAVPAAAGAGLGQPAEIIRDVATTVKTPRSMFCYQSCPGAALMHQRRDSRPVAGGGDLGHCSRKVPHDELCLNAYDSIALASELAVARRRTFRGARRDARGLPGRAAQHVRVLRRPAASWRKEQVWPRARRQARDAITDEARRAQPSSRWGPHVRRSQRRGAPGARSLRARRAVWCCVLAGQARPGRRVLR